MPVTSTPSPLPAFAAPSHSQMAQLLDQAPEVLHHIFQCVEITDLAALSRTCRYLNKVVQNDELLWKLHYLFRFVRLALLGTAWKPDIAVSH